MPTSQDVFNATATIFLRELRDNFPHQRSFDSRKILDQVKDLLSAAEINSETVESSKKWLASQGFLKKEGSGESRGIYNGVQTIFLYDNFSLTEKGWIAANRLPVPLIDLLDKKFNAEPEAGHDKTSSRFASMAGEFVGGIIKALND